MSLVSMDVDDLLEPGERVIWLGRPTGRHGMMGCEAIAAFAIVGLLILPALGMAWAQWDPGSHSASPLPWWRLDEVLTALGPTGGLFGFIGAIALGLLFVPMALARNALYAVTDRRVIIAASRWSVDDLPRAAVRESRIVDRSLEIVTTDGRRFRFDEIDDPEAARDALFGEV